MRRAAVMYLRGSVNPPAPAKQAPALLAVLLRLGVKESPVFEAGRHRAPRRHPLMLLSIGVGALAMALGPALVGALNDRNMDSKTA